MSIQAFFHSSPWTYTPAEAGWYKVALRACTPTVECGPYYRSSGSLFKLVPPDNIDLIPLPLRQAKLKWVPPTANIATTEYTVEIHPSGESWTSRRVENLAPHISELDLDLDQILTTPDRGWVTLLTHTEVRIKATVPMGTAILDSGYSEEITIIDSPIISINGDSRRANVNGQAIVKWERPNGVESQTLRWRKLGTDSGGNSHSDLEWLPDDTTHPSIFRTANPSITSASEQTHTAQNLSLGEIYAFQLIYTKSSGKVFSARDHYVWPSKIPPGGRRSGSNISFAFPCAQGSTAKGVYEYRICDAPYAGGLTVVDDDWKKAVRHALGQWQAATNSLVEMTHIDRGCASYDTLAYPSDSLSTTVYQEVANRILSVTQTLRPSNRF